MEKGRYITSLLMIDAVGRLTAAYISILGAWI